MEPERGSNRERSPGTSSPGSCPVCGPTKLAILPFRYRFRERYVDGVRCDRCGVVFLDPMLNDEEIASLYGEEYFTECSDSAGAHGTKPYFELAEDSTGARLESAGRFDRALRGYLGSRGRFFEIGCGPGFFLAAMRELGWEVGGLEISTFAVREAQARFGLELVNAPLIPGSLAPESNDAVFLGDVLEHLPRPLEALREVHRSLRPNGVVTIAVPSTLNLLSGKLGLGVYAALGRSKTIRIPPYHLFEYTPRTLRHTLGLAGFRVLRLRQSAVPLRRMGLRGSAVENAGKASLQVLAHVTSRVFNAGGDRLLAFARREAK